MYHYLAVLTQTGPNAPTTHLVQNTFTAAPSITRVDRGVYKLQFNIDLNITDTIILIQMTTSGTPTSMAAYIDEGCVMLYADNEDYDNVINLDVRCFIGGS